jgi:PleD family two-component response regulator
VFAVAVRTIPVFDDGEMIGVIEMFNRETETKELFRHLEELEEFALQDDLTKLPNRRYIDSYMEAKYAEHMKHGDSIGLAFLDIDHFRNFNNKYGHAVGDKVLKNGFCNIETGDTFAGFFVGRWAERSF